ncbi:2-hydroxyacyl-CoA dehydratase [Thermodesulfobacteriota bacterium]
MSQERGAAQLESANAIRAYQREWIKAVRERVDKGEPFAICNGDEFEEIFNIMDIPVIVINYWNSIISVKGMMEYYLDILGKRGYEPNYFALGLASTMDNKPDTAPWGGLPKPAIIIGGTKNDMEMRVLETWAREYGCPFVPLEFGLDAVPEQGIPPRWWEKLKDHWDDIIDPRKLDLRVAEEEALISFLEVITGHTFSSAKLGQALELINEQMEYWGKARDLIAETIPCPVSLRDQLAVYQAMWHRGTPKGLDFIKSYYEEVKDRVDKGVAAWPGEKLRLMWMAGTPPRWARYAEEKYDAVCVCSMFSSIPIDSYPRTIINNDPMRTLASRHMILFMETPEWRLKDARLHQCDGVVEAVRPSAPSFNEPVFDEAGMPFCVIPGDRDDEEVRSVLSDFIEKRLLT